ncbi:MAG: outer membrane protein assembly factor BamA [Buchnera aphidicola (Periphyllus acericola)]|uniref:outer membrane protein assembly factor BamA n=1 Tax=Buchnera aphidicola TaxID=9 RepID=UPI0030D2D6FC|nr:outer membrane protein assembly factor BamA [Buchnera aphidicola (Periphyllus acericola)]
MQTIYNKMKLKNLFLIFLIIFTINIGYANNNSFFKKIEFHGLKKVSKKEALKLLTFRVNESFPKFEIQHSINELLSSKKFNKVDVYEKGKTIIFQVVECPFITKINVVGNNFIELNFIEKVLQLSGINENNFITDDSIIFFKNKLLEYYSSVLKNNVDIKFKFLEQNKDIKILEINISEGVDSNIKEIKINGNKKFSSKKIMSFFSYYNKYCLLRKIIKSEYNYLNLQEDLKNLYNFYNRNGYITFDILDTKINYLDDKKNVSVTIIINEGDKYNVSKVLIDEDNPIFLKNLKILSKTFENKLYNIEDLIFLQDSIQQELFNNGYINSSILINPLIDRLNHTVQFTVKVQKNDKFFVKKILFDGNFLTKRKYLIRKMLQKENSVINRDFLNEDLQNLQETDYFDRIDVEFKNHSDKKLNYLDVIYHVKEKKSNNFNIGFAYDNKNKLNCNLQLLKNHFLRTGNVLSLYLSQSLQKNFLQIFYMNPYFTKKNLIFNENVFFNMVGKDIDLNLINKDSSKLSVIEKICYAIKNFFNLEKESFKNSHMNYGEETSIGIPFLKYNTYNFNLGYSHYEFSDSYKNFFKNIPVLKKNTKNFLKRKCFQALNNIYINHSLNFNTTDNLFFPNSGCNATIALNSIFPYKNKNYFKFIFDIRKYFPILCTNNNVTFLFHSYFGCELFKNNDSYIEDYDNFHAENDHTVRGYYSENIGSKIFSVDNLKDNNVSNNNKENNLFNSNKSKENIINNCIGGNFISITNLELISSIPFLENEYLKSIRLSTFLDFGRIWMQNNFFEKKHSFMIYNNPKNIYSSFGVSLKWKSPFGLLSFSYAIPIKPVNKNDVEKFQISFG